MMTDSIKATIIALIDECRRRWPKADYISVQGPEVNWFKKTGLESSDDWWLYVSRNGTLYDSTGQSPQSLLEQVQELGITGGGINGHYQHRMDRPQHKSNSRAGSKDRRRRPLLRDG